MFKLDNYSRRENLKFSGIPENDNEQSSETRQTMLQLFENKLDIADASSMKIQRCHRLGYTKDRAKYPREVIIRFAYYPDRDAVWSARFNLEGSGIYMKEDYCREIDERRSKLYPVLKAAKGLKMKAKLTADILTINGQSYTINTLHTLPANLLPKNLPNVELTLLLSFSMVEIPVSATFTR
jgi:hypothetical protein